MMSMTVKFKYTWIKGADREQVSSVNSWLNDGWVPLREVVLNDHTCLILLVKEEDPNGMKALVDLVMKASQ